MIIGRLLNLSLKEGDEHISTTWEVASDYSFREIIAQSEDDTKNKVAIVFKDIIPENGKEYFGRAKVRTRLEGWSVWHNLDITVSDKLDTIDNIHTLPSVISIPRLSTYVNDKKCKEANHPIINFDIVADGYATINNTKHISTSWYIEDLSGHVIWKSEFDTFNKDRIKVVDVLLDYNQPYNIRACFHSETKDSSDLSSLVICTSPEKNLALRIFLENNIIFNTALNINAPISLELPLINSEPIPEPGKVGLYFKVIEYNQLGHTEVFSTELDVTQNTLVIPERTFKDNRTYALQYKIAENDNWEVLLYSRWKK